MASRSSTDYMPQARGVMLVFIKNNIPSRHISAFQIGNYILHIPIEIDLK